MASRFERWLSLVAVLAASIAAIVLNNWVQTLS
jgi:hypothetical protein